MANPFVNVELMTTDVARAKAFTVNYSTGGWKTFRGWST